MIDNQIEFRGTIVRCVYSSPTFKTYACDVSKMDYPNIKFNKFNNVSIIGDMSDLVVGVEYEITATEEQNKYGISYRVTNIRRDMPTSADDAKAFLEEILTYNQAQVLFENYPNIIELVKNNEADKVDLARLHGIGAKTFEVIKRKIIENFKLADLVGEFKGVLSLSMLRRIYAEYPDIDALRAKLREEPYKTLTRISGVGYKTADSIVLDLQKENIVDFGYDVKTSYDRCLACIIYILKENEGDGNTCMNLADLRKQCLDMIPSCVNHFVNAIKSDDIYYDKLDMSVGLARTYETERYIADAIAHSLDSATWDYDVEKYRMAGEFVLSDEQIDAIRNVCRYNVSILNGPAGCVDCDTEFFNGTGWKRIADYEINDKVLQYNENGTAELVDPLAYIKQPAEYLWHFETKYGLDQCLSDNHNCYYITSKGNLYHKTFKEVRRNHEETGFKGKFITSFDYSGCGIDLTDDEIRLMVATFADGSFYSDMKNRNDNVYKQSRFHLKKQRKKDRLVSIINKLGLKYRVAKSVADGYDDYYVNVPFRAKHFPVEWYNCNKHQLSIIADEVMYWDGRYDKHNDYSTTNKSDADFIQFVYSSLGYRATIVCNNRVGKEYDTCGKTYTRKSIEYIVSYTKTTLISMNCDNRPDHIKTTIEKYDTTDGFEYCFTVPSHMLVLRRNNKIFVTGNCGKSQTTLGIIKMLEDNDKEFALMAPTGKASKILSGYTGKRATTIHRGLCYNPREGWFYNNDNKLPYDIVIVDEASMIDVALFRHLVEAIDFESTRLLLIGDNAQLPSVGCGNLLHDFMTSKVIPSTTLTKVFRYGEGGISKVATDTRFCKPYLDKSMKSKTTQFGKNKDYVFIDINSESIMNVAVSLYKKLIDKGNKPQDVQVLVAKNVGDCGTIVINSLIQKAVNSNYGNGRCMKVGDTSYYDGDLIIQTQNNYKAEMCDDEHNILYTYNNEPLTAFVSNGETAVIKYACKDYVVMDFDGALIRYDRAAMNMVSLAYAISVFKAQGSGIKNVIICTPKSHMFMLNSNLIYVALTRTTNKCFHLGQINVVNTSIKKKANLQRNTFMCKLLKDKIVRNANEQQ